VMLLTTWYRNAKRSSRAARRSNYTGSMTTRVEAPFESARRCCRRGFDGTPVVLMQSDRHRVAEHSAPVAKRDGNQRLKVAVAGGFFLEAMDGKTLVSRRTKKDPASPAAGHPSHTSGALAV